MWKLSRNVWRNNDEVEKRKNYYSLIVDNYENLKKI